MAHTGGLTLTFFFSTAANPNVFFENGRSGPLTVRVTVGLLFHFQCSSSTRSSSTRIVLHVGNYAAGSDELAPIARLLSPALTSLPSFASMILNGGSLWHLLRVLHHPNLYHSCCQDDRCLPLTKPVSEHQLMNMLSR
jgi:hypothetical protein